MIKIKVGSITLTEAQSVDLPQEFAAWHQTVLIAPGPYGVFAYLACEAGTYRIHQLSAECEGITTSSNFRSHLFGTWGKSDNNRNGQLAIASLHLPTYGRVGDSTGLLAQATLCSALIRTEWDPSNGGRMWRFTWDSACKPIIIEQARYSGGTSIAAFEDARRFTIDAIEMSPNDAKDHRLSFTHLYSLDQIKAGETVTGWSFREKRSCQVTRVE